MIGLETKTKTAFSGYAKEGRMFKDTTLADVLFVLAGYAAIFIVAGMAARLMQP